MNHQYHNIMVQLKIMFNLNRRLIDKVDYQIRSRRDRASSYLHEFELLSFSSPQAVKKHWINFATNQFKNFIFIVPDKKTTWRKPFPFTAVKKIAWLLTIEPSGVPTNRMRQPRSAIVLVCSVRPTFFNIDHNWFFSKAIYR